MGSSALVSRVRGPRVPRGLRAVPSNEGRLRERALTRVVAALVLLALLSVIVGAGLARSFDDGILTSIQIPHATWVDLLGSLISLAGDSFVTAGIAAGLVVARLVKRRPEVLVPLAIAVVVVGELALKAIVPQPAPPHELARSIPFLPTLQAPVPFAFPSGHVARLTFLLAITSVPTWASVLAIAAMGLSRVYLAEHWATDVVGGLLLGLAVAWGARELGRTIRADPRS